MNKTTSIDIYKTDCNNKLPAILSQGLSTVDESFFDIKVIVKDSNISGFTDLQTAELIENI